MPEIRKVTLSARELTPYRQFPRDLKALTKSGDQMFSSKSSLERFSFRLRQVCPLARGLGVAGGGLGEALLPQIEASRFGLDETQLTATRLSKTEIFSSKGFLYQS